MNTRNQDLAARYRRTYGSAGSRLQEVAAMLVKPGDLIVVPTGYTKAQHVRVTDTEPYEQNGVRMRRIGYAGGIIQRPYASCVLCVVPHDVVTNSTVADFKTKADR